MPSLYKRPAASILTGVARFDGIEIRADSITDPRRDRVLPVMEEEQIFMCRQMDLLLRREGAGALALDVGTGSGVFAIWAAKRGCRVLAIDISARAVKMANQNAVLNGIDVAADFARLQPGQICSKRVTFDDQFTSDPRFAGSFQFVFLNPPYNPTCPRVRVALHAESGEDAQRCFREQIALVPKVLRRGGWCIGNQMTVGNGGAWEALDLIRTSFGNRGRLQWCDILDERRCPTEWLLRRQYVAYLKRQDRRHPTAAEVAGYITRVSRQWPELGLIYYQIQDLRMRPMSVQRMRRSFRLEASWSDRAVLHRHIVEHSPSAPRGIVPTKAAKGHTQPTRLRSSGTAPRRRE